MLKTVTATRYVTPLREGGSLPAIMETDSGETYVVKFSGAGQGVKALIADIIGGEIARRLGLNVPELALVEMDAQLARGESHEEIRDLLEASVGINLGLCYLPNALNFDPLIDPPDAELASLIVWLDAYITNVDRTPRNVNMLVWEKALWLIDHGAALYFHHMWDGYLARSQSPFAQIKDHVLLPFAHALPAADVAARARLTEDALAQVVALIPDIWLGNEEQFADDPAAHRAGYMAYLTNRLASNQFVQEAIKAHDALG